MEKDQIITKMQIPTYLSWFFVLTLLTTFLILYTINFIYKRKKDKIELLSIKKKTILLSILFITIILLQTFISLDLFLIGDKYQVIKKTIFNPNFLPISITFIFTILGFSSLFIKKESIKIAFQKHFVAINSSLSLIIFIFPNLIYGNRFEYNLLVFLYYLITIITSQLLSYKLFKNLNIKEKTKEIFPILITLLIVSTIIYILNFLLTKYTTYTLNYSYLFDTKFEYIDRDLYPIYSFSIIVLLYFGKNYYSNFITYINNLKEKYINKNNISIYMAFLFISLLLIHDIIFFSKISFYSMQFFKLPIHLLILGKVTELIFFIIFIFIIYSIFKSNKLRIISLLLAIIVFQILFLAFVTFSKYGQIMFDFKNIDIAYNPAGDNAKYATYENIIELILEVKYIHFIPTIIFISSIIKNRKNIFIKKRDIIYISKFSHKVFIFTVLLLSHLVLVSYGYSTRDKNWKLEANKKLYSSQVSGLFNSYFYDHVFEKLNMYSNKIDVDNKDLEKYNKNKDNYTNIFGQNYSNTLKFNDLNKQIEIDPTLTKGKNNLNGILKDKNLIIIQLESVSELYLGLQDKSIYKNIDLLPNVFKVMNQSLYFENYYDNTGIAWTMDADYTTHTGIVSPGNNTLYWDLNNEKGMSTYVDYTLPILFNKKDYNTISLVAAEPGFYNLNNIHKTLFEYKNFFFYSPEKYKEDKEYNLYLKDSWFRSLSNNFPIPKNYFKEIKDELNDLLIPNIIPSLLNEFNKDNQKYFIFTHTSVPHFPFISFDKVQPSKHKYQLSREYGRIIDFYSYIDKFFFYLSKLAERLDNVAFLIYGDHNPQGYPKKDLDYILGKNLSNAEYIEKAKRVLSMLYVPDKNRKDINGIPHGLIKGKQSLVRSQIDNYRTIVELFDLEKKHMYFGTNLLSNENTFVIDPKGHNIITDKFSINGLSTINGFKNSDIYYKKEEVDLREIERIFKYTYQFKHLMDNMYFDLKYELLKLN